MIFRLEQKLEDQYSNNGDPNKPSGSAISNPSLSGELMTKIRKAKLRPPPGKTLQDPPEKLIWLCYAMEYQLKLRSGSSILGPGLSFTTTFYPFETWFYTRLEQYVDRDMLLTLLDNAKSAMAATRPGPSTSTRLTPHADLAMRPAVDASPSSSAGRSGRINVRFRNPSTTANPTGISDGTHNRSWRAVINGENPVEIDNVHISNPALLDLDHGPQGRRLQLGFVHPNARVGPVSVSASPMTGQMRDVTSVDTPGEFTVEGEIMLFGFIPATITKHVSRNGIFEVVRPKDPSAILGLDALMPALSEMTGISLSDVQFTYQSAHRSAASPRGLRLSCHVALSGPLEPIAATLKDLFGQAEEHLTISVSGLLALTRGNWTQPPVPVGFSLRAELLKLSLELAGGLVEITELGVDVHVGRGVGANRKPQYTLGVGFLGSAGIHIPGSAVPMRVSWYLQQMGGWYELRLHATDDEWTDVLGVHGLNVSREDTVYVQ